MAVGVVRPLAKARNNEITCWVQSTLRNARAQDHAEGTFLFSFYSRFLLAYVSVEPQYRRVVDEEGSYDAHAGYAMHAAVTVPGGHTDHYIHNHLSRDEAGIAKLRGAMTERGVIDIAYWSFCNRDHNLTTEQRIAHDQALARQGY